MNPRAATVPAGKRSPHDVDITVRRQTGASIVTNRTRRNTIWIVTCATLPPSLACRPSTAPSGDDAAGGRIAQGEHAATASTSKETSVNPKPAHAQAETTTSQKSSGSAPAGGPTEVAYFAGGCFWGLEHYFQLGPGVVEAVSGYMQGSVDDPTYRQVCSDTTGHAETVKVVFDPRRITYRRLLEAFFAMHDPTTVDRQGPDVGSQYRSGIWYADERQKTEAEAFVKELSSRGEFRGRKIVTQIERAKTFYPAEAYHQDYIEKTGGACHVSNPW